MPPKKKGKGKGAGGVIDGVDTSEMSREQLEAFAHRLRDEMEREREERNYFQLERDKVRTYWDITRQQLDEARATLRTKERDIEETEEKNQFEMKCFKQKVKHLLYEHQAHLSDVRAEGVMALKAAQDDHDVQEGELLKDKTELKISKRAMEQEILEQIRAIKIEHSKELSEVRTGYEQEARQIEGKYEKEMQTERNELNVKHRMEIAEVEERKNQQIVDLIKSHELAFRDLKIYYNDITINNLALITSLKEQMEDLKNYSERMERQVSDIQAENRKLVQPLKEANEKVNEMSKKLQNYEKDKIELDQIRKKFNTCEKDLYNLRWSNGALELRFEKVKADRDYLNERFVQAVMEVQQKTGLKTCLLKRQVDEMTRVAEHRDAVLDEILTATNLNPKGVSRKLEVLLRRKNAEIQDLQYELARVCKAHDDLLKTYECKLQQYGIPVVELGFLPLRTTLNNLGKGPAGLVTLNQ